MANIPSWEKVYGFGMKNLGTLTNTAASVREALFTADCNRPGWWIGATASVDTGGTTYNGVGDWWQVFLNNVPNMDPGQEIIEKEKSTGKPFRDGLEYQSGVKAAKVTVEMDVTVSEIIPLLWAFCGSMGSVGSGVFEKCFLPYVKETASTYTLGTWLMNTDFTGLDFDDFRDHDYGANEGICLNVYEYVPSVPTISYLNSGVPTTLNFSSEENGTLTVSSELVGHSIQTTGTFEGSLASATRPTGAALITPLLHQNAAFVYEIDADGTFLRSGMSSLATKNFSLNLTNNANVDFFDEQSAQAIIMQKFGGTIELTFQWDGTTTWRDAHENNQYATVNAVWEYSGSGINNDTLAGTWAAGDFAIGMTFRVTGYERTSEAQVMEKITGEIVAVGTNTPIMFKLADGIGWDSDIQD